VPATLPDVLKTDALMEWEYAARHQAKTPGQAIAAAHARLDWLRGSTSDYEIAVSAATNSRVSYRRNRVFTPGCAARNPARAAATGSLEVYERAFPQPAPVPVTTRDRCFRRRITVFGPRLAVVYVGRHFRRLSGTRERVQARRAGTSTGSCGRRRCRTAHPRRPRARGDGAGFKDRPAEPLEYAAETSSGDEHVHRMRRGPSGVQCTPSTGDTVDAWAPASTTPQPWSRRCGRRDEVGQRFLFLLSAFEDVSSARPASCTTGAGAITTNGRGPARSLRASATSRSTLRAISAAVTENLGASDRWCPSIMRHEVQRRVARAGWPARTSMPGAFPALDEVVVNGGAPRQTL
jgi:hypothetical protein